MKKAAAKNRIRKTNKSSRSMPWHYFLLMVLCIAVMTAGFFFTAVQHFSAIDLGIKNSELRARIGKMEAEHRRLKLEREIAGSPAQIKKTALRMGFREFDAVAELASLTEQKNEESNIALPSENILAEKKTEPVTKPDAKPSASNVKKIEQPEAVKRSERSVDGSSENKKKTEQTKARNEVAKLDSRPRSAPSAKPENTAKRQVPVKDDKKTISTASVNAARTVTQSTGSVDTRPRRVN